MSGPSPGGFFAAEHRTRIEEAIRRAELKSSGEIRVHVGRLSFGVPLLMAWYHFRRLSMHHTIGRTGVLIYLAVADRRFAIYGDKGISSRVGRGFWDDVAAEIECHFKRGEFVQGVRVGVDLVGDKLGQFFPRDPHDINELPDVITFDE